MMPGDELERDDVVVLLCSVPERVADLVSGLDETRLRYRHAPAFPTLLELVTHLAQAGTAVDSLFRQIQVDGAECVAVRPAIDPPDLGVTEIEVPVLLDDYTRIRRRTVDLLRGMAGADWERRVSDTGPGEISILDLARLVTRHELGHLTQVRNLIAVLPEPEDLGPVAAAPTVRDDRRLADV